MRNFILNSRITTSLFEDINKDFKKHKEIVAKLKIIQNLKFVKFIKLIIILVPFIFSVIITPSPIKLIG